MSTQEHLHMMQLPQLFMVDGDKTTSMETFHLHTIVDNISKQPLLSVISVILLVMAVFLVKMAWAALNKPTDNLCKTE